ncbi:retrotransposon protein, putative, ty1-copia subclass [Tanacetum coccineum]
MVHLTCYCFGHAGMRHAEVDESNFDESNTYVLERFYTLAGNPVKEILLKLNLPDHRRLKDGGEDFCYSDTERLSRSDEVLKLKNFKKDATLKLSKSTNKECFDETLKELTKLEFLHTDGDVFVDYSWERALSIEKDVYPEWLCRREHVLTLLEFVVQLGLYEESELEHRLFALHFRNGVDVVVMVEFIRAISATFANTVYGFFLGKRVAYPVVANYFNSMEGLDAILDNGPWFICNNPLILKKWNPDVNLLKEDVGNVPVWVKLHGVPVTAFSEDGLSAIATKLGTPLMLDSYTSDMCIKSYGRSSYARAMIEVRADVELKDTIVVAMPKLTREVFYMCNVCVEYDWKPPRCACCKVFGHVLDECPNNIDSDVVKNMIKPSQTSRGVPVGLKVGFKPVKQVYNRKKDAEPIIEVSNSNPFDVLNSVENNVDLGTNGGSPNLTSRKTNTSGFLSRNVESINDEGKPLKKVDYSGDHNSKDKVASTDNDMANFLASKKDGYGNNSLLEEWKESYMNGDYDFDPYDDDMYEGQNIPDKI